MHTYGVPSFWNERIQISFFGEIFQVQPLIKKISGTKIYEKHQKIKIKKIDIKNTERIPHCFIIPMACRFSNISFRSILKKRTVKVYLLFRLPLNSEMFHPVLDPPSPPPLLHALPFGISSFGELQISPQFTSVLIL